MPFYSEKVKCNEQIADFISMEYTHLEVNIRLIIIFFVEIEIDYVS